MSYHRFSELLQARVTEEFLERLKAIAERRSQTLSAIVREFVVRGVEREEKRMEKPDPIRLVATSKILKKFGLHDPTLEKLEKVSKEAELRLKARRKKRK